MKEKQETWKTSFHIYISGLRDAYKKLINDQEWLNQQERFNPGLNIKLTLEKACTNFWATEAGWQHKKRKKSKDINWRLTLTNSLSLRMNKVYKDKSELNQDRYTIKTGNFNGYAE